MFFDRVVNVARLVKDSNNRKKESYKTYSPLYNTSIQIQPASAEDTVIADGTFGQAYIGFTTASGILEGDKLTDIKTGETFIVKGKTNWMSPSFIPHVELLLVQFETSE